MCDPLTAAGIAMSAGSMVVQQRQQKKNMARMVSARNAATEGNLRRQDKFGVEARETFGETLDKFRPGEQSRRETDALTKRRAVVDRAVKQTGDFVPVARSAPDIVGAELKRKSAEGSARAVAQGNRGAKLSRFGDVLFGNSLDLRRSQGKINEASDFARGVALLLPIEQKAAETNAYKALGPLANIMKLAGTAGTLAGMKGMGPSWGDIFGPKFPGANLAPAYRTSLYA